MIETPKNLTRNILLGLFLGFLVASFFYYTNFFPTTFKNFIQEYIFNLGGDIFLNLLKLMVVPLVFFSLVSGISSLSDMRSLGSITIKTV
ncbi:MAG: cation:dicarboxylase symporter family transporter, partial [Pseudomonadota bacterium]|nr:cation:dicarboxylase symporter family transporter [Pseudomonadota bacterium]